MAGFGDGGAKFVEWYAVKSCIIAISVKIKLGHGETKCN